MADCSSSAIQIGVATPPSLSATVRAAILDFWTLTKPEVNFLIVIATCAGFYLGCPGNLYLFPFERLLHTLFGTLLVASGAGALNQYLERHFDARMQRTRRRPIAAGRLRPATAAWFGISLSTIGAAYLAVAVSSLASVLAVFTLASYLFVYTPLKRKTPLCTLAGAFPGATPPLIGWAAASGSIAGVEAWVLYAVLFLWQVPHFMAIAWMYREDYARAGYRIFPSRGEGSFLAWQTGVPAVTLFIVTMIASHESDAGNIQLAATATLGSGLLYFAARHICMRSRIAARQLLKATIIYLPLELLILALGKG
jgi:protoheme IX farnesyltransferase